MVLVETTDFYLDWSLDCTGPFQNLVDVLLQGVQSLSCWTVDVCPCLTSQEEFLCLLMRPNFTQTQSLLVETSPQHDAAATVPRCGDTSHHETDALSLVA